MQIAQGVLHLLQLVNEARRAFALHCIRQGHQIDRHPHLDAQSMRVSAQPDFVHQQLSQLLQRAAAAPGRKPRQVGT